MGREYFFSCKGHFGIYKAVRGQYKIIYLQMSLLCLVKLSFVHNLLKLFQGVQSIIPDTAVL